MQTIEKTQNKLTAVESPMTTHQQKNLYDKTLGRFVFDTVNEVFPLEDLITGKIKRKDLKQFYSEKKWDLTLLLQLTPRAIGLIQKLKGSTLAEIIASLGVYLRVEHKGLDPVSADVLYAQLVSEGARFNTDEDPALSNTEELLNLITFLLETVSSINEDIKATSKANTLFKTVGELIVSILPFITLFLKRK